MTRSDELKAILGKARRYVNSARMLQRERDYDSAVSRLYYAMFYCAEALLLARGFTFSSHRAVISGFAQHFVKAGLLDNKYHNWLREAFEKRQISDYDYLSTAGEEEASELERMAEDFLSTAEEFLRKEGHL